MGCGLYGSTGNLLTFVSFCDKNTGVWVICGAGYSLENTVHVKQQEQSWLLNRFVLYMTMDLLRTSANHSLTFFGFDFCSCTKKRYK